MFNAAAQACDRLRAYLDGVAKPTPEDIESDRVLIRKACKQSIYFFAKEVLGFDKLSPQTHRRWAEDLKHDFFTRFMACYLKPRGTYKTTLYGEAFPLWIWAVVDARVKFLYTSANQSLLDEVSAHMKQFLKKENNTLYSFVFQIWLHTSSDIKNTQDVFNLQQGDYSVKGNGMMFRTAGGSTNGCHPNMILVDDPMDKEDRQSETIRKRKREWYDTLHPLIVPRRVMFDGIPRIVEHLFIISTRWHLDDLIAHIIKQDVDGDVKIESESIYIGNGVDEDGNRILRYPELHTHELIRRKYLTKMSEVFFSCQMLNDPLPDGVQLFAKGKLRFLKPEYYDVTEGTNYCFLDPAKGTEEGAYPAVVFVNRLNGRNLFFDAIDSKLGLSEILALAAKKCKQYKVRSWIFETNGTTLMRSNVKRALMAAGYRCAVFDIHETRNKPERIASMQPDLQYGENYFRTDYEEVYPEMMKQFFFYPAYGPVDFPDIVEKAVTYITLKIPGSFENGGVGGANAREDQKSIAGSFKGGSNDW